MRAIAVKTPSRGMMIAMEALGERLGFRWRKEMDREFRYGDCAILFILDGKWLETWGRHLDGLADRWANDPGNKLLTMNEAIEMLQPTPPKPITIVGRTLSFPGDGSVKLSCGETISAEVCDEIERRRKPKSLYRTLDKLLYRPRTDGGGNGWQVFDERQWINSINSINDHAALPTEEITEAEARQRFPEAFQEAK